MVYAVPGRNDGADRGGKTGGNFTRCGPDEIRALQDKKSVETLYHRYIIQRHVNLDSGELVAGSSADTARQKCEKLAPERDPAQVRQRCTVADVFFVKDKNNEIQQVIIPVTGKGAKSMMHAFLALGLDGRTVRNLYYYQQRETPFLGLGGRRQLAQTVARETIIR